MLIPVSGADSSLKLSSRRVVEFQNAGSRAGVEEFRGGAQAPTPTFAMSRTPRSTLLRVPRHPPACPSATMTSSGGFRPRPGPLQQRGARGYLPQVLHLRNQRR
jgi:hypothetical protein